jgi:hypothetical protein
MNGLPADGAGMDGVLRVVWPMARRGAIRSGSR